MASSRYADAEIDKLIKKLNVKDEHLITKIKNVFNNDTGYSYSLLKDIYDSCHSKNAIYKKKERRNLLIRFIKDGNCFAIDLMMSGPYHPDLNEKLLQKPFVHRHGYTSSDDTPLFFALKLGQFAVASYIMNYFKALLQKQPNVELSAYYVSSLGEDPLDCARACLKKDTLNDQQRADGQSFIDDFFDLLPHQFVEKNPVVFRPWGPVDFYTFLLDQKPSELIKLLETQAIPAANLRSSVQHLLYLSINRNLYAVFDLLLMMVPDHIYFTQPIAVGDGDTLLNSCIGQDDAYFLFALLELNPANAMLSDETEASLNEVLAHKPVCRLLFKLYATNCSIYLTLSGFIREQSERLRDMPDPLSFFRPSKVQGLNATLSLMDTPEKFFRGFISRADFSDVNEQLEGQELFKYAIEKIGLVDFSYMSGDKLVSTNLSNILLQNRLFPFSTPDTLDHLGHTIKDKVFRR